MEPCRGKVLPVKRYVVNLDSPPEEHFVPVFQDPDIQKLIPMMREDVKNTMTNIVPAEVLPLLERLFAALDQYLPQPFAGEMRGIAKCTGIPLGEIVALNLAYDLTTYCTSIVAQDAKGIIWHGRNLDWASSQDALRDVTVMLDFQSKGQTLYTSTTFLGFVGVFTGQRPNKCTVTVNLRHQGELWMNALEALLNRNAKIMSFLVRETLAEADSYDAAIQKLSAPILMAPVYFIVGGANEGEGAVITRNRQSLNIWGLQPAEGRWFVLQTNYDHWDQPPPDDDRRTPGTDAMNKVGQAGINASSMFEVLSVDPVLNYKTIYTTTMSAAQPQVYNSWIRCWPEGQARGQMRQGKVC